MDAKAMIPIGLFSRGGRSRVVIKALDHDFKPEQKLTPFGIFLPDYDELYLFLLPCRLTSDAIVDCLEQFWQQVRTRFAAVERLLVNQDNGPENHSRRTQFMKRMTAFVDSFGVGVELAYYPPYHSKYNPIERVWGVLEQHWNGSLLDSLATVVGFAQTMTYNGVHPVVSLVKKTYQKGVRLSQKAMAVLEERFARLPGLGKYFVEILPLSNQAGTIISLE